MTNDVPSPVSAALDTQLEHLRLGYLRENHESLAQQAAREQMTHVDYLAQLIEGEAAQREQRARTLPEPGALHLTRREDLLDLETPEPDLSLYDLD